jgi:hypothetical protein
MQQAPLARQREGLLPLFFTIQPEDKGKTMENFVKTHVIPGKPDFSCKGTWFRTGNNRLPCNRIGRRNKSRMHTVTSGFLPVNYCGKRAFQELPSAILNYSGFFAQIQTNLPKIPGRKF